MKNELNLKTVFEKESEHPCAKCKCNRPHGSDKICAATYHVKRQGVRYVKIDEVHNCYDEGHGNKEILLRSGRNVTGTVA